MSQTDPSHNAKNQDDFTRHATEGRTSFFAEYIYLLKHNKKWWMLPLILVLLGFGVLMVLSTTGAAPFIYTLF